MALIRFIAKQLGNPSGLFGRMVMTRLLDRGNDELISSTLATLDLDPGDRYLDVGFGGGASIEKAARVAQRLVGVDPAKDMIDAAMARFAELVREGRLELKLGTAAELPLEPGGTDKILTTNTVYFWPDLDAGLRSLAAALAPGGRLAIGLTQRAKMERYPVTKHGFRKYEGAELAPRLEAAGLTDVRVVRLYGLRTEGDAVVVATAPT